MIMSRFFSKKYESLVPYTPGEQPKGRTFIKLNTNESPFPPSPKAQEGAKREVELLQLYPDPTCSALVNKMAQVLGVKSENVLMGNGSDEVLNFAFMAFCDKEHPAAFADITYGFYSVFAELNGIAYLEIPLNEDFTLPVEEFCKISHTLFIANPNAPTGLAISLSDIERILSSNPDRVVVIDEAYVDFGGQSAVSLIDKYENLLVTGTFSKSRSMAGARLGYGVANAALIGDLHTLRNSTNPYNINRMTMAAGIGVLEDEEYTKENCKKIIATRARTAKELEKLGFEVIPSLTNFLFAKKEGLSGMAFYKSLREKGVLVRHFETPRLKDYNRITVGSDEEMDAFLQATREILKEKEERA